jgi:hypothetical protein
MDLVVFFDLAGLPGWGSDIQPSDPDTSTILERYLGPAKGEVRLVQGCTALAVVPDVRAGLLATMEVLAEASRTSGSATAGAQVVQDAPDQIGPGSSPARAAAALASVADAARLLVTAEVIAALQPADGSTLSFDAGPTAEIGGGRVASYSVRRR